MPALLMPHEKWLSRTVGELESGWISEPDTAKLEPVRFKEAARVTLWEDEPRTD
jgi:hypothetical protein